MGVTPPAAPPGLRWLAVANLVANIGIVLTGGAVRLTGSGLGCPTWPRCTQESYVVRGELGIHGAIEFGNRMVTFVVAAIAVACLAAAWLAARRAAPRSGRRWSTPFRDPVARLAGVVALGVPAQALIGGMSVLTELNPWVVSLHLLVSLALVGVCLWLVRRVFEVPSEAVPRAAYRLAWLTFAVGWVVLYLGTVVTGSGPHAGDARAQRNGLDPQLMSHVHAVAVYLLVALTGWLLAVAVRDAHRRLLGAAGALLTVELAQGAVGFTQYQLDLPELLVGVHLLGAALTSVALANLVLAVRRGGAGTTVRSEPGRVGERAVSESAAGPAPPPRTAG